MKLIIDAVNKKKTWAGLSVKALKFGFNGTKQMSTVAALSL